MKNIQIAQATVTGRIVYDNGDGLGKPTFIPFSITIGDNCCEGHAEARAMSLIADHIKIRNEAEMRYSFPELARIEFEN